MKKIKKLFAILTACVVMTLLLSFMPSSAASGYITSKEYPNFRYIYVNESAGTISVAANAILSGQITIPAKIDGKTVVEISSYGFSEQSNITSVTIPDTVTKIDSFAFNGCTSLSSVSIPDAITNVGVRPFLLTPFETSLINNAKNGFVTLDDYILYHYTGSDSDIKIPYGIRVIANSVFAYDEESTDYINSVIFPDSVEYICEYAFWECNHISSVTFGSGIKDIKLNSFTCADMTICGYAGSYAQLFAQDNGYSFDFIINFGETRTEIEYTDDVRQYYFSDEIGFSKNGIKVYERNYDGALTEITDWYFSKTPKALY